MKKNNTINKLQKTLAKKVVARVLEEKSLISGNLFEAPPEETQAGKDVDFDRSKLKDIKFTVYKTGGNIYKVRFPFLGKLYVVEFSPDQQNPTHYNSTFYVQNMKNSDRVNQRFGITAVSQIEPLFEVILKAIKKFLTLRKPALLRFLPGGEAGTLPSSFYVFTYKPLKQFQTDLDEFKPSYSVARGADSSKAAFVLYRGGGRKLMKTQSWRPKKDASAQTQAPATESKKLPRLKEAQSMRLKRLGPQETEIETPEHKILFSYEVPVAYLDKKNDKFYRTNIKYSVTTSRHIKKWLNGRDAFEKDQSHIDSLLKK